VAPPGSTRYATSRRCLCSYAQDRCFQSVPETTGRTIPTTRTSRCGRHEFADGGRTTVAAPGTTREVSATFEVARDDGTLTVTRLHGTAAWRLLLIGVPAVTNVDGGGPVSSPNSTEISVPADIGRCSIEL
jgi:hypothetical protein